MSGRSPPAQGPSALSGLGMTSLVLAAIALFLFFLPVLGIPISACGLMIALVGCAGALCFRHASLRWNLAGLAASCLAIGVNVVIAATPAGLPTRPHPNAWNPPPEQRIVPAPAPGGGGPPLE